MKSIFSELPHGLIIDIIRIENDRKKEELITKRKTTSSPGKEEPRTREKNTRAKFRHCYMEYRIQTEGSSAGALCTVWQ